MSKTFTITSNKMDILQLLIDILVKTKSQFDKITSIMTPKREVNYENILKIVYKCKKITPATLKKQFDRVVVVSGDDLNEEVLVGLMCVALVNACSIRIHYQSEPFYYTYLYFKTIFNRLVKNLHMQMPFVIIKHNSNPKECDFKYKCSDKALMQRFMKKIALK